MKHPRDCGGPGECGQCDSVVDARTDAGRYAYREPYPQPSFTPADPCPTTWPGPDRHTHQCRHQLYDTYNPVLGTTSRNQPHPDFHCTCLCGASVHNERLAGAGAR